LPKILYIEDDPNNRALVRRILMAYDFDVEESDNAIDGIELAKQYRPDLILMDISMPGMDGLTATTEIRKIAEIADMTVVALTANAMEGDREMTLEAGCNGYISKPINVDTFIDEISAYL
jgi:two-component system, cell cycle response regulator DivK